MNLYSDTIAAISTPAGVGGIAVIRISGPESIQIADSAWSGNLSNAKGNTISFGKYISLEGRQLDEALISIFRAPHSFTGEDTVEISLHGSKWIQREVLSDLMKRGARIAEPGEFTQRAFLNGKMDLAQAEGVADLISSSSKAAHAMALSQMKGNFSEELKNLRNQLIELASLLELELDFSEEDVEFADRTKLLDLAFLIKAKVGRLASSYSSGSVLKDGVPVVIAGIPNAGKSSLLNLLLKEDKAIVSEIPGTTRDIIEGTAEINGILYRFIDTAGLRNTKDYIEGIGIERAWTSIEKAGIVVWVFDVYSELSPQLSELKKILNQDKKSKLIILINKSDLNQDFDLSPINELLKNYYRDISIKDRNEKISDINHNNEINIIRFSTKTEEGLEKLLENLHKLSTANQNPDTDLIVTNARHYEALIKASESLDRVIEGLKNGISGDFIAQDLRESLHYLGLMTGEITTDNLLHSIFSKFCIGK